MLAVAARTEQHSMWPRGVIASENVHFLYLPLDKCGFLAINQKHACGRRQNCGMDAFSGLNEGQKKISVPTEGLDTPVSTGDYSFVMFAAALATLAAFLFVTARFPSASSARLSGLFTDYLSWHGKQLQISATTRSLFFNKYMWGW